MRALRVFIVGGIDPSNARVYLDAGASHVIVTSYVFRDGRIDRERLAELIAAVGGRERLVLDLSCRKRARAGAAPGGGEDAFEYVVVTDRWQRWTDVVVNAETLAELSGQCEPRVEAAGPWAVPPWLSPLMGFAYCDFCRCRVSCARRGRGGPSCRH